MKAFILEAIYRRRSIREFTDEEVSAELLHEIIRAGSWAPSGLNNQPWRFVMVQDQAMRARLAEQTRYRHIVLTAPALLVIYLDREAMYDAVKDHQAAGACVQNMLLAAEALDLGAVWLGQILQNKDRVNEILGLSDRYDLMAVIALGHPRHRNQQSQRRNVDELILKRF
jgi:nitroreductase